MFFWQHKAIQQDAKIIFQDFYERYKDGKRNDSKVKRLQSNEKSKQNIWFVMNKIPKLGRVCNEQAFRKLKTIKKTNLFQKQIKESWFWFVKEFRKVKSISPVARLNRFVTDVNIKQLGARM